MGSPSDGKRWARAFPAQVFDPREEFHITDRRLPHWSQAGTICFITWRTWDSMPAHVLAQWLTERDAWLRQHGIDPSAKDWESRVQALPAHRAATFHTYIANRWNGHLDNLHGSCVLRRPAIGRVVADSLRHFDAVRYHLSDFVIMPNHVHLLAAFPDADSMLA